MLLLKVHHGDIYFNFFCFDSKQSTHSIIHCISVYKGRKIRDFTKYSLKGANSDAVICCIFVPLCFRCCSACLETITVEM